jgi:uncharacterized protein (TIGR03435 family)
MVGSPSSLPSIIDYRRPELGLKVEERKEPLEFIVVDHLERPTEN